MLCTVPVLIFRFDMDHTLVRYKMGPFHELIFSSMKRFLIQEKGYPQEKLDSFEYDEHHAPKGQLR